MHPERGWLLHLSADGSERQIIAKTGRPNGLCIDGDGTFWVAESVNPPSLLKIKWDGAKQVDVEVVLTADSDGPFLFPNDLAFGPDGLLYMTDSGVIALTAFISPYRADRDEARAISGDSFIEIYAKCSLDECELRDPKGLYKKARAGEIPEFTGISAPYEEPEKAEIVIETDKKSLDECVIVILDALKERGVIS
ncbi:MAG: adenylyl-sulfate kinase [Chloroflexi bacterium]|nr:adenylyl-sulfate kinase [Chloroflexota bacterium]